MLTFGEPTGLELPEVEVPGSGRLLPTVREMPGGVTDDMTIVGGVADASRVRVLLSVEDFGSADKADDVVTTVVDEDTVVVVVDVFDSLLVVTGVLPSILLDRSLLSIEFRASMYSLVKNSFVRIFECKY